MERETFEESKENHNQFNRRLTVSKLDSFQKPPKEAEEKPKPMPVFEKTPDSAEHRSYLQTSRHVEVHHTYTGPEHGSVRHFIKNIADENDRLHHQTKKALTVQNQELALNHMLMSLECLRLVEVVRQYENSVKTLTGDIDTLEKDVAERGRQP